jgi:hypothetical protein
MALSFEKLMARNPFEYGRIINSIGQVIIFLEHPTKGDEAEVICACPELQKADYSGFFDLEDMLASHGEYMPWFDDNGALQIGDLGPASR